VAGLSGREYKVEYPCEMQFCVPEGMWVAEANEGPETNYHDDDFRKPYETYDTRNEVIGAETQRILTYKSSNAGPAYYDPEFERYEYPAFSVESYKWLHVSRRPFGIVSTPTKDGEPRGTGRFFTPARQIHKGEVGRKIPVNMPKVVRTPRDPNIDEGYAYSQKTVGWVRLDELARKAWLFETELLERFYPFNDFISALFPMVIATTEEDFEGRIVRYPQRRDVLLSEAIKLVNTHPTGWVWVRASWAATVLRLRSLRYQPEPVVQAA
jgi:hypothetical protein